ncbi:hypothetical protein J6590_038675 [Homalodisca vitripennis]|nr:hypothetical protein J6590_038675 [Homalodisca vitripennis]
MRKFLYNTRRLETFIRKKTTRTDETSETQIGIVLITFVPVKFVRASNNAQCPIITPLPLGKAVSSPPEDAARAAHKAGCHSVRGPRH